MHVMRTYFSLTKPGIVMGNVITCVGGFALASKGEMNFLFLLITLLGLSFIIAAGCVSNNYIDRVHDGKMERTKKRALVQGEVHPKSALVFSIILAFLGVFVLAFFVNLLTTLIACIGLVIYLGFYSFLKYRTVHGTLIGSLAGAIPPVVGYCAVIGSLDRAAFILFLMIAIWQMPHFYAIAVYRMEEYRSASIPVLPLIRGLSSTKIQMLLYILAFIPVSLLLVFLGYVGPLFGVTVTFLSSIWIVLSFLGFKSRKEASWARQMFLFSLVVVLGVCMMIPLSVIS